nr:hypothetical protein [uncultured Moraxella sp.]
MQGGENGIDNIPHKGLANRILWLKNQNLVKKINEVSKKVDDLQKVVDDLSVRLTNLENQKLAEPKPSYISLSGTP